MLKASSGWTRVLREVFPAFSLTPFLFPLLHARLTSRVWGTENCSILFLATSLIALKSGYPLGVRTGVLLLCFTFAYSSSFSLVTPRRSDFVPETSIATQIPAQPDLGSSEEDWALFIYFLFLFIYFFFFLGGGVIIR